LCHWIITATYIDVSFKTRMLLNKNTYIKSATELVQVTKFRYKIIIANIVVILIILTFSIVNYNAVLKKSDRLYAIAYFELLIF